MFLDDDISLVSVLSSIILDVIRDRGHDIKALEDEMVPGGRFLVSRS